MQKAMHIPPFKRTVVIKGEDLKKELDVGSMPWSQLHELARPIDLKREAW